MRSINQFDSSVILATERLCRNLEQRTGKSNYFFLKLLTGFYALFVLFWVLQLEQYGIGTQSWHNALLFAVFCWFFYISFSYCDKELVRAKDRLEFRVENVARTCAHHVRLRNSLFVSTLMTLAFCVWSAIYFQVHGTALLLFIPFCISPVVFWICLILDVCDPLPAKNHSV